MMPSLDPTSDSAATNERFSSGAGPASLCIAKYRTHSRWITAGASGAVVVVLLASVLPTFATLSKVSARTRQQERTVATLSAKRASLPATVEQVNRLRHATTVLHSTAPADQQVADLVKDLRRLNHAAGLGDMGWTPGETPTRAGALSLLPVKIHVTGEYTKVLSFMTSLQSLNQPIRLRDVQMTADTPGSGRVHVRLTVVLVTAEAP